MFSVRKEYIEMRIKMINWVDTMPESFASRRRHPIFKEFKNIAKNHILTFKLQEGNISIYGVRYLVGRWNKEHTEPQLAFMCKNSRDKEKTTVWIYVKGEEGE